MSSNAGFWLDLTFFAVGFLYLIKGFLYLAVFARSYWPTGKWTNNCNSWALVTACTDGIGLGFAQELAKNGFNIVQVGRNHNKLNTTAQDLMGKFGVQVKNIVKDFSLCPKNPQIFFLDIFSQCQDLDIRILVNNVGCLEVGKFMKNAEFLLRQNALNLFPIVFMTRIFIEKYMEKGEERGIINISSLTGEYPLPLVCAYSAGKSFGKVFSEVISEEGEFKVLCLEPGYVWTPLGQQFRFKSFAISKEECARIGVMMLGRVSHSFGHWTHFLCFFFFWALNLSFGIISKGLEFVFHIE